MEVIVGCVIIIKKIIKTDVTGHRNFCNKCNVKKVIDFTYCDKCGTKLKLKTLASKKSKDFCSFNNWLFYEKTNEITTYDESFQSRLYSDFEIVYPFDDDDYYLDDIDFKSVNDLNIQEEITKFEKKHNQLLLELYEYFGESNIVVDYCISSDYI